MARRKNRHEKIARTITGVPFRGKPGSHTFTTVKGYCIPARVYIQAIFKPLHIRAHYGFAKVGPPIDDNPFDRVMTQDVTVNAKQKAWAEYVLGAIGSYTDIRVKPRTLIDQANYGKGLARSGAPMPWAYKTLAEVPADGPEVCFSSLPKGEQDKVMKNGGVQKVYNRRGVNMNPLTAPVGVGTRFTSEGKKRGSTGVSTRVSMGRFGPKRGKRSRTKRGSHRGR